MVQKYFTVITKVGLAKIAKAAAVGSKLQLSEIAVGDGSGRDIEPSDAAVALVHEVYRGAVNRLEVDPKNSNQIIAELVIPEDYGDFTVREVGVFDVTGDLIAVGNLPATYKPVARSGTAMAQVIRVVLQLNNVNGVGLKIDPSVVLATREYVDAAFLKNVGRVDSVARLRQSKGYVGAVVVDGLTDDLKAFLGGVYVADMKDKTSADDGYKVIVDANKIRWKRLQGSGDVVNFETREKFVAAAEQMASLPNGMTVFAGGYQYIRDAELTYIPDLPGWRPVNESFGHFNGGYIEPVGPTIVRCRFHKAGGNIYNITEIINPRPGCINKILLSEPNEGRIASKTLHEFAGKSSSRILLSCDGWTQPVDGKVTLQGLQIIDGKVYRDWASSDFDTNAAAVWMKDGRLKIARSKDGKSAAQWVKEGAAWTASFARGPALVENGQLIANSDTYLSARAAIGQRADRSIVLLNLEGISGSYGATLEKSAQIMLDEGCVTAVALDAGGSSQVWYGDAYACPSSDNSFQTGRAIPSAIEIIADIIEPYDTGWIPVTAVAGVTAGSDAQGGAAIAYRQTGKQIEMRLDVVAELKTNKELIITSESMPQRFLSKDYRPIRGMASGFGGALVSWWSGTYISLLPQKDTPYAYGSAVWYSKNCK